MRQHRRRLGNLQLVCGAEAVHRRRAWRGCRQDGVVPLRNSGESGILSLHQQASLLHKPSDSSAPSDWCARQHWCQLELGGSLIDGGQPLCSYGTFSPVRVPATILCRSRGDRCRLQGGSAPRCVHPLCGHGWQVVQGLVCEDSLSQSDECS